MTEIAFFRQMRVDGGIRTGVSIDRATELQRFEPGSDDSDPALLWFIDIRCKGPALPREPREARQWLLDNAPWIGAGLDDVAEHLRVGIDSEVLPFQRSITGSPPGIHAQVVGSAVRRIDAKEIANHIRSIRRHWKRFVAGLEPIEV